MSPGNLGEVPSRQQGNQIQILEAKKVWSVYEKKKKKANIVGIVWIQRGERVWMVQVM